MYIRTILLTATLATPSIDLACQFDTDCGPITTCLKGSGQIKGVCVR